MSLELRAAKKLLRSEIATALKTVSTLQIQKESEAIEASVLAADWFTKSTRISVFVSTEGEIITDGIIKAALSLGKTVFIPRFERGLNDMQMLQLRDNTEFTSLKPTLWGIRQFESAEGHESYEVQGPLDLVLLPGVAFTPNGDRLGHGKGYYDRFLAEHRNHFGTLPRTVGLALTTQIVKSVPTGPNDVHLDDVISSVES